MLRLLKPSALAITSIFVLFSFLFAADETLTITTYYPSPYGSYNQMNVGVGSTTAYAKLTVSEFNESTTQTNFNQTLVNSGINIETEYTVNAFTPGIFWSTNNNSVNRPKAGIYLKETGTGTFMHLGTSNSYATGITNDGLVIDPSGYLGIGTTAPAVRLDIAGDVNLANQALTAAGTVNRGYYVYKSGTTAYGMKLQYTGAEYGTLVFGPNQASRFINFGKIGAALEDDDVVEYARIDLDNGNVGIGTTNPATKLQIGNLDAQNTLRITGISTANMAPVVSLYRSGTYESIMTTTSVGTIIGTTGGLANYNDATINAAADIVVANSGNIGIGTTSPSYLLSVYGGNIDFSASDPSAAFINRVYGIRFNWDNSQTYGRGWYNGIYSLSSAGASADAIRISSYNDITCILDDNNNNAASYFYIGHHAAANAAMGTAIFTVASPNGDVTGSYGNYHVSSDGRLKKDISTIDDPLAKIAKLRGVYYYWKDLKKNLKGDTLRRVGMIAQEVEEAVPEVVHVSDDEMKTQAIKAEDLVGLLVEGIKEQQKQIDELKQEVSQLKQKGK